MHYSFNDFSVSTFSRCPHSDCDEWLWTVRSTKLVLGDFRIIHAPRNAELLLLIEKAEQVLG